MVRFASLHAPYEELDVLLCVFAPLRETFGVCGFLNVRLCWLWGDCAVGSLAEVEAREAAVRFFLTLRGGVGDLG